MRGYSESIKIIKPMVVTMKWAMIGLGAMAQALTGLAYADPHNADIWLGFENSDNGFLLDEDTGDLWMTGSCLKTLSQASLVSGVWVSQTVEMVSVGRLRTVLDQRISLEIQADFGLITVESAGRGGPHRFDAIIDRACEAGSIGQCSHLISTQVACEG